MLKINNTIKKIPIHSIILFVFSAISTFYIYKHKDMFAKKPEEVKPKTYNQEYLISENTESDWKNKNKKNLNKLVDISNNMDEQSWLTKYIEKENEVEISINSNKENLTNFDNVLKETISKNGMKICKNEERNGQYQGFSIKV